MTYWQKWDTIYSLEIIHFESFKINFHKTIISNQGNISEEIAEKEFHEEDLMQI